MGGGGGTLDKRGGLRDELGYIAPPNRKLPPVPGSNYNTCDRVKRQAVISEYSESSNTQTHSYSYAQTRLSYAQTLSYSETLRIPTYFNLRSIIRTNKTEYLMHKKRSNTLLSLYSNRDLFYAHTYRHNCILR